MAQGKFGYNEGVRARQAARRALPDYIQCPDCGAVTTTMLLDKPDGTFVTAVYCAACGAHL